MKSICKLAMVVLLLVGSYKMYGQSGNGCDSNGMMACMNGCEVNLEACQSLCGGEGSSYWVECMDHCNFDMCDCAWTCGTRYGCDMSSYCPYQND